MRLGEAQTALDGISVRLDKIRIAGESLKFCREVYKRYTSNEPANEHMDPDKALAQLLDSVDRMILSFKDRED